MRYAVIADVHGNLEALEAVLKKLEEESFDALLFLGDSVGYGPNPNECIEILKKKAQVLLAGNHDLAAAGLTDTEFFNPHARTAIEWTQAVLKDENKKFLASLPIVKQMIDDDLCLVHSTPKEPEKWHYLISNWDAYKNFPFFSEKICLIGHSHVPAIIEAPPEGKINTFNIRAEITENYRYIINAGSVGQPRDGNPDAAYVLLTEDSAEIKRVSYDILLTQEKMRHAGLPDHLIERLAHGR
ncbi:MAG: metallophosphoesterase family protein [Nitrospirae bacterium]|nr:metallophosphoesterase family protein [Nitrospirota bacterium]